MDYIQIKKILLAEYTANGGTNSKEFLRGMTYLEDYLESGRRDHFLNAHVDELAFLRKRVDKLENEVVELERTLKHKQNVIKQYRQMNKDERYKWKASQELMNIEKTYSRMVMELENADRLENERKGIEELKRRQQEKSQDEDRQKIGNRDWITDVDIYPGQDGNLFIRCRIDGIQQAGKQLNDWNKNTYNTDTDKMRLASIYFNHELIAAQKLYGVKENPQQEQKKEVLFLDALTYISMYAGWEHLEFEDTKQRSLTIQNWAREFTEKHAATDWEQADYMELVDKFAAQKVDKWLQLHPQKDDKAARISHINVYPGRNGGKFIRCRIDGEQQMAVQMSFADTVNFNDRTDLTALAIRYFKEALQAGKQEGRGMKR